jgi:acetyltransferase-like isoleucine patch superfamily enzyme
MTIGLAEFKRLFLAMMQNKDNRFHPLVWINGDPQVGEGTYIGGLSEINAKGAKVRIGRDCDIASFVAINVADSHKRTIGVADKSDIRDITIGDNVFIGSHSVILGGTVIGDNCVIAAGSVLRGETLPPFSLAVGNPVRIKKGYYRAAFKKRHGSADPATMKKKRK